MPRFQNVVKGQFNRNRSVNQVEFQFGVSTGLKFRSTQLMNSIRKDSNDRSGAYLLFSYHVLSHQIAIHDATKTNPKRPSIYHAMLYMIGNDAAECTKLISVRRKSNAVVPVVESDKLRLEHDITHNLDVITSTGLECSKAIYNHVSTFV